MIFKIRKKERFTWKAVYGLVIAVAFAVGLVTSVLFAVGEARLDPLEITNEPVPIIGEIGYEEDIVIYLEFVERGGGPYTLASAVLCDSLIVPLRFQHLPALLNENPEGSVDVVLSEYIPQSVPVGEECRIGVTVEAEDFEVVENFRTEPFVIK